MEQINSDELPSTNKELFEKLVLGKEMLLETFMYRMPNPQLLEFYDYVVEMSEDQEDPNCHLYWYASMMLEEMPVIRMYKNGQLYVDTTLNNNEQYIMMEEVLSEEERQQINETLNLLAQRKKEKNKIGKKILRYFRGR